jgi:hypothetical protein
MTSGSSCPAVPPAVAVVVPEVGVWVEAGRAVLSVVEHAEEWDAGTRRVVLGEVDRVERIAALARARLVAAEQAAGTWALRGDRDLAGFLGRESHQGRGAGCAVVGQAATLAAMPAVAQALVDGPVTAKHLQEISRATAGSPRLAAQLASPVGQEQIVELARRFDGSDFARQLQAMSASVDPLTRQREHDEQRANRFFEISQTRAGALIKGALDSVAGYKVQKMLDAFNPRPAADDERSRGQRQADALLVAVDRALADKQTTPGAHAPVEAIITITEQTWAKLRAARNTGAGANREHPSAGSSDTAADVEHMPAPRTGVADLPWAGSAGDLLDALAGVDAVVDETGRVWPASEVGRALCDCALTRAVVDAFGQVLDLGRGQRLFARQHWLALLAMGITTCAWPGCGMPLRYTELHHLTWWDRDNGPTSLANCAPYCSFHHHQIHRHDIRITRMPDGRLDHRHPDGRPIGDRPISDRPIDNERVGVHGRFAGDLSDGAPPGRPRSDGVSISQPRAADDDGRPPDDRDECEPLGSLAHPLGTASGEQRDTSSADASETDYSDVPDDLLSLLPA